MTTIAEQFQSVAEEQRKMLPELAWMNFAAPPLACYRAVARFSTQFDGCRGKVMKQWSGSPGRIPQQQLLLHANPTLALVFEEVAKEQKILETVLRRIQLDSSTNRPRSQRVDKGEKLHQHQDRLAVLVAKALDIRRRPCKRTLRHIPSNAPATAALPLGSAAFSGPLPPEESTTSARPTQRALRPEDGVEPNSEELMELSCTSSNAVKDGAGEESGVSFVAESGESPDSGDSSSSVSDEGGEWVCDTRDLVEFGSANCRGQQSETVSYQEFSSSDG